MFRKFDYLIVAFSMAITAPCFTANAQGADFRCENKVFAHEKKSPASQGTTIFQEGVVYDFIDQPQEVIVYDQAVGKLVLLDLTRRIRAEVATAELETLGARAKQVAGASANAWVRFMASPAFQESFDAANSELTLSSPWMTYRAKLTSVPDMAMAHQCRDFLDWCARLQIALEPGARPPQARMALNAAIAKHQAVARQVELTYERGGTTVRVRSEHSLVPRLAAKDLADIGTARAAMETFKQVEFAEYRKGPGR